MIEELGFKLNFFVRNFCKDKLNLILVIFFIIVNNYFVCVVKGIEDIV